MNSCREWVDGNYQSCQTCKGYVSCIAKELYSRSCPDELVWDDRERQCAKYSTTCSHLTTRSDGKLRFVFVFCFVLGGGGGGGVRG